MYMLYTLFQLTKYNNIGSRVAGTIVKFRNFRVESNFTKVVLYPARVEHHKRVHAKYVLYNIILRIRSYKNVVTFTDNFFIAYK
jgi:hypothetical protein